MPFALAVTIGLGLLTWLGSIAVHDTTRAWFEKDVGLRREAIRRLGGFEDPRAGQELAALYASEADMNNKREIIRSLRRNDNASALVRLARQEKDPALRKEMVRMLAP